MPMLRKADSLPPCLSFSSLSGTLCLWRKPNSLSQTTELKESRHEQTSMRNRNCPPLLQGTMVGCLGRHAQDIHCPRTDTQT